MIAVLGVCLVDGFAAEAGDYHLDSPRNTGLLRLELNNDIVFGDDSQFSNGFSLQYHTRRYSRWEESMAPGWVKWVGDHFPSLGDEDAIVRYGPQHLSELSFTQADVCVTARFRDGSRGAGQPFVLFRSL